MTAADESPPPQAGFWKMLQAKLTTQVDASSLVFVRVGFGAIMMWEVWRYFSYGWIKDYWIDPEFHFTYACFRWVTPWPGDGMYIHMIALAVLACFIMIGFLYRISTTLFFFGFSYIFLIEKAHYLNHFYFVILVAFLMIFVPAHRCFSVDAYLRKGLRSRVVPAWSVWSIRVQLGIVYFFGGVAKINPDWLRGEPMRMWMAPLHHYDIIGPHVHKDWFVYSLSYGGLLFDLLIVPMLLWRKTRWIAFSAAAFFHIMNSWIFSIGIFPWLSLAVTTIYFAFDWPLRLWAWLQTRKWEPLKLPAAPPVAGKLEKGFLVALALFFGFQCYLPFRHLLYPGNVNWTEEGHRFSWRMKLRSKDAYAKFVARDPATGEFYEIVAEERLTRRQFRKMVNRPDMILEFARYIAAEMAANGIPNAEVRVRSLASLNGRRFQILIDPEADLAKAKWGLAPSRKNSPDQDPPGWVLPLTEKLHPEDRTPRIKAEANDDGGGP